MSKEDEAFVRYVIAREIIRRLAKLYPQGLATPSLPPRPDRDS